MKKTAISIMTLVLAAAITACGSRTGTPTDKPADQTPGANTETSSTPAPTDTPQPTEAPIEYNGMITLDENNYITREISPLLDQDGADPFVTLYNGKYLFTKTTGGNVCIAVADSLETLGAAELKCVYDPKGEVGALWAPEIWRLDGKWYIYFAATLPGSDIHYMFVLENSSDDPMEGEWTMQQLAGMDDKFAIDGTVMELNDRKYFIWSGWEGYENVRQDIYMAEMVSPLEVKPEKILLSMPELYWEKHGTPLVNEGPEVIIRGETVNLVYSASGSWTDDYCLGLLTMNVHDDPKVAASWTKHEKPVFSKVQGVYGPGHNSFVKTLDGRDDLIIYHAARWNGGGWNRSIRFGYVTFDEKGELLKAEPVRAADTLTLPECEKTVVAYKEELFSDFSNNDVSITINATEETDVCLVIFAKFNKRDGGILTEITATVNGESRNLGLCAGMDYLPLYYKVHLKAGANEVVLGYDRSTKKVITLSRMEVRFE